jgi:hypothetical protein
MPDDVTSVSRYEQDFYAWAFEQAELLRAVAEKIGRRGKNSVAEIDAIDWANLAEEIEGSARRDRRELRSRIGTIIEHLTKLDYASAGGPRAGWRTTITRPQQEIRRILDDSPSLRRQLSHLIPEEAPGAVRLAVQALAEHGDMEAKTLEYLELLDRYTEDSIFRDVLAKEPVSAQQPARPQRGRRIKKPT